MHLCYTNETLWLHIHPNFMQMFTSTSIMLLNSCIMTVCHSSISVQVNIHISSCGKLLLFCRDQWLECARAAFASVDASEKGHISSGQLINLISSKLPAEEVEHAVEQALMEAGCGGVPTQALQLLALVTVHGLHPLILACRMPQRPA